MPAEVKPQHSKKKKKTRQSQNAVLKETFTSPSDAQCGVIPLQQRQGTTQTPPHHCNITQLCHRFSSQRSSTSTTLQVTDGHNPHESRPRLLFAFVVVRRCVFPFLDHLIPLLEDGFQPHSLAKHTQESGQTQNRVAAVRGALTWSLAQVLAVPKKPHSCGTRSNPALGVPHRTNMRVCTFCQRLWGFRAVATHFTTNDNWVFSPQPTRQYFLPSLPQLRTDCSSCSSGGGRP